jgi:hypothetical protein
LTVTQVGRTTNSITINVSGITQGDRQTFVWIEYSSKKYDWFKLDVAYTKGYISDYTPKAADNPSSNGNITITFKNSYWPYKVAFIKVANVNTTAGDKEIQIKTVFKFEYDNSSTKYSGNDIDITVADMRRINLFGSDIDTLISGNKPEDGGGSYYALTSVGSGDSIFADYLNLPAQHILNASIVEPDLIGESYSKVYSCARNVANNCVSGADFKAKFFNDIADAINNFNLTCTI